MAFEEITHTGRLRPTLEPVTVALHIRNATPKNRVASADVEILIRGEALTKLGWQPGARVKVAEGTGTDRHLLQLSVSPTGYSVIDRKTKGGPGVAVKLSVNSFRFHQFVDEPRPATAADFQTFGSTLTVNIQDICKPY